MFTSGDRGRCARGALESVDVALAAAGTTTWELCRAGVPAVLVAAANNEVPVVTSMVNVGAAVGRLEAFVR